MYRLRSVPLVSRRFSEACRDPSLWPELYLPHVHHAAFSTEARWRSFLRWLAARGSGLRTRDFDVDDDNDEDEDDDLFDDDEVEPAIMPSSVCSSLVLSPRYSI